MFNTYQGAVLFVLGFSLGILVCLTVTHIAIRRLLDADTAKRWLRDLVLILGLCTLLVAFLFAG